MSEHSVKIDAALGAVNYVQLGVGVLSLVFLFAAAAYVIHRQRMIPVLRVLQLRLLVLLAAFLWVASALAGDDALFYIFREFSSATSDEIASEPAESKTHERWCLAQKIILLGLAEPGFFLLIAQLVQLGATPDSPASAHTQQIKRTIVRPLLPLFTVQLILVLTERWFSARAVFVETSQVPTEVCIVPTANLIVSVAFSLGFIVYFNLICVRMSLVVISRHIKARLWTLQLCHSVTLPLIWAIRVVLIVGFGFATRYRHSDLFSTDALLSGLRFSHFLVDVEFFLILGSAMLSVHALVWRPLREIDRLSAVHRRQLVLEVDASRVETSASALVDGQQRSSADVLGKRAAVAASANTASANAAHTMLRASDGQALSASVRGQRVRLRVARAFAGMQPRAGVREHAHARMEALNIERESGERACIARHAAAAGAPAAIASRAGTPSRDAARGARTPPRTPAEAKNVEVEASTQSADASAAEAGRPWVTKRKKRGAGGRAPQSRAGTSLPAGLAAAESDGADASAAVLRDAGGA